MYCNLDIFKITNITDTAYFNRWESKGGVINPLLLNLRICLNAEV